jgi:hypothetical protein
MEEINTKITKITKKTKNNKNIKNKYSPTITKSAKELLNPPKKQSLRSKFANNKTNQKQNETIGNNNNNNNIIFLDLDEKGNSKKEGKIVINNTLINNTQNLNKNIKNYNAKINSLNNSINKNINTNVNTTIKSSVNKNLNEKNNKNIQISAGGIKSFYMNIGSNKRLKIREDLDSSNDVDVKTIQSKPKKKNNKKRVNNSDYEKPKKLKVKEIFESNIEEPKKDEILDDYELNHLPYLEALQLDERNFCKIYCSLLKRDQIIMSTFGSCNDYNLLYVKIVKFIFIISTLMAMNAFLFADKSFHKLFISGVNYYYKYQYLQIIISVILTYIAKIFVSYLTMTDRHLYEIKSFYKKEANGNKVFEVLKCIKYKLIIFYILSISLIGFYWYYVSAFCAVYPNTIKIYFIDCLIGFVIIFVIPFILYAFMTLLRVIALKDNKQKRMNCLYSLSKSLPIF